MAVLKCKKCGADLPYTTGTTVAVCEYCNVKQTLPKNNDETIQNMFNRATHLRMKAEFDKAEQIYEKILQLDNQESEAHWGLVLCKYGIEYVEDSKTSQRVPTCHRASFESVTTDVEYLAAIANADAAQKAIYEAEAKALDKIQKDILNIVKNEDPFDVFICYKQSDDNNKRTPDSVIANDIYHQLTQEGLKVFYAAITLEDKLGQEYEPYIFAALNSAKVMLVIGTKPEYFSAVWVKNEWSRFLKLMKSDRSKLLIPCYKDMDAYDLPEEFSHLQAQDMSKIGFINDVVRGIRKVIVKEGPKPAVVKETIVSESSTNTAPLLKRAFMFLEDGDWKSADEYCEKVLDIEPECAQAYLCKLMADLKVKNQEALKNRNIPFDGNKYYQKIIRFADPELITELEVCNERIKARNEEARMHDIYTHAQGIMSKARDEKAYLEVAEKFERIQAYRDAAALAKEAATLAQKCREEAEAEQKNDIYLKACTLLNKGPGSLDCFSTNHLEAALKQFESIVGWKDSEAKIQVCRQKIEQLKAEAEADRLEREQKEAQKKQEAALRAKRNQKIALIAAAVVCVIVAFVIVINTVIIPGNKYNNAVSLMNDKQYANAISAFADLGDYKDCTALITECQYQHAKVLLENGYTAQAASLFTQLGDYKDSSEQLATLRQQTAVRDTISAGGYHAVGIKTDGTIVTVGTYSFSTEEKDIVAVSAGSTYTLLLKSDGTVSVEGFIDNKARTIPEWTDIISVSAGETHAVGLKADGTVVTDGNHENLSDVSNWTNIAAISAGLYHTVGLKADGTVVVAGPDQDNQWDVSGWTDIIAISVGTTRAVGLKADGTVVVAGPNQDNQWDVSGWTDIIAIAVGTTHAVGLKADGTVVVAGPNQDNQWNISDWTDIVAISAGRVHTVGLKADGTVVVAGAGKYSQHDVADWTDIKLPD